MEKLTEKRLSEISAKNIAFCQNYIDSNPGNKLTDFSSIYTIPVGSYVGIELWKNCNWREEKGIDFFGDNVFLVKSISVTEGPSGRSKVLFVLESIFRSGVSYMLSSDEVIFHPLNIGIFDLAMVKVRKARNEAK